jgi:cysteine desulfurase/selenocysteine lyase
MSTPDSSAAGGSHALPAAAATTPGLSPGSAHVPGAPTLPAPDPVSITLAIARLANELFAAAPPPVLAPTPGEANVLAPPPRDPPSPPLPSPAVPSSSLLLASPVPASPFSAPLDFSAIAAPADPFAPPAGFDAGSFPSLSLIDPRLPSPAPAELPAETPAMSSLAPAPSLAPTPSPTPAPSRSLALDSFEIIPAGDPVIRSLGAPAFDPNLIRREFPILQEPVRGRRLVWLDNAATTQKPQTVIDRISYFYEHENSNVHRAAHTLAARATDAYEGARDAVRRFLRAPSKREIVFVRGTTEGINLVAKSWGGRNVGPGDEVVVTWLEHHANIVPWQQLCSEKGARLRVAPVDDSGQVILEEYEKLLGPRTRIVAFTQVSNALGTVTPAAEMIAMAHRHGALALLDGAQAVSHMPVDVQALGCDFFVFSGHKVFGPTGIGAVLGRAELLDTMPPWQGGGNMISDVTFERTLYQPAPARFEAGTGNIADAVGLGAALDWLSRVGVERVQSYEHGLLDYATEQLATVPGLTMIGTARDKAGVLSFVLDGQKTEEIGGMLDQDGIAVRSGHHCAQPILRRFGLEATVRASLAPYNTCEDVDALVAALRRIQAGRPAR